MTDKPSECPICYESLELEKSPLICGHWVHVSCAKKQTRDECPLCRTLLNLKSRLTDIVNDEELTEVEDSLNSQFENSDMECEPCEPWKKNGYLYREEDIENYDEENPDGDSVYYD